MTAATSPRQSAWATLALWIGCFLLFAVFVVANKDLVTFLRYLLLGLPLGAVIALIAVGYSMVYGIIQLINFAHGEVFMFSGYFVLMLVAAPARTGDAKAPVVSALVFVLAWCATWVIAEAIASRRAAAGGAGRPRGTVLVLRAAACTLVAAAVSYTNYRIMPKTPDAATLPFALAWVIAIAYTCCLGLTIDLLAYRPLRGAPRLIPLITAIGVSLFLISLAQLIWGAASRSFPDPSKPALIDGPRLRLWGGLGITRLDFAIIILALALMVGMQLFIHATRAGKAMRACAQDRTTAALMGIRVNSTLALAFAIGAGLAAVVAPLYVLRGATITPQMGYAVGILAFASAVLGGIGNITGAMLGGLVIGIIFNFVPLFDALDTFRFFKVLETWGWVTREGYNRFVTDFGRPNQYQYGIAYAFMILVIVIKPTGLLGRATAKRA